MKWKLVSAIDWRRERGRWSCGLICLDEGFERVPLEQGSQVSFRVLRGRYCVGFTRLSTGTGDEGSPDAWKEFAPCPQGEEVHRGTQCGQCSRSDVSLPCLRCDGGECLADPALRRACEGNTAYVYLASFGAGRIKAGVSQGRRVVKRWIEQGADAARRVLVGNGREARRFEKRIQEELGILRLLKAEQKTDLTRSGPGIEESMGLLDSYEEEVHRLFPEENRFHEEPRLLLQHYGLPRLDRRPLELRVRGGLTVSGRVLGAKGPVLLIEGGGMPFTVSLSRLVGRRIETEGVAPTSTQAGLERFLS